MEASQVIAPSGNPKWLRSVVDKTLRNGKYVPYAIPMELFVAAQFEKGARTNIQINNDDSTQRKTTRYSSQNVLSGLLVCAECGRNYRRITRPSGEVVWRCDDKVEKGRLSSCKYSPCITDTAIKDLISKELGLAVFDERITKKSISQLIVEKNAVISVILIQNLSQCIKNSKIFLEKTQSLS